MKTQTEIARYIREATGSKAALKSTSSFLSLILNGKRTLPENWKIPLMTVCECTSSEELLILYPKIRLKKDERIHVTEGVFRISAEILARDTTQFTVSGKDLHLILNLISQLQKLGVCVNLHVEPKMSAQKPDE